MIELSTGGSEKPAVLITAATHSRELISTSMAMFELLKLNQLGHVKKDATYEKLLK